MKHITVTEGLKLFEDGTWMRDDDLTVRVTKIDWKERVYYKSRQYFTHRELAEAFVENPHGYRHIELKDETKRISADNLRWIKYPKIKMDSLQAEMIRKRVSRGESQTTVAKDYGVSRSLVSRIIKGERW